MPNKPFIIIFVLFFGISVGIWNIFIGISDKNNIAFVAIGVACMVLSYGLFKMHVWVKIPCMIFSGLTIFVYIFLLIGTIKGYFRGFGGIGLIANFPALILSR